ncbi:hypothetical protein [Novosphingobium malaysiense]|uniref:Extradiol ring-cleavage dioxygenase LigAB LigA subunit domain-containing protein n=1 Tax=Novosphingobium malaysiense TaxID=1348853 RepID=A0A0B1ZGY0_9SPHN|nr:hypothetical protein [Novosphingobium malaysiense]KHK90361.1 hypothetical protein LK12_17350 [Novosphingobium malaysiense]
MSAYTIMKCLRECTIDPATAAAVRASDPAQLATAHDMSLDEAQAMLEGRVDLLDAMGVHPFSLIQLSRVMGFSIDARWAELLGGKDAGEKTAGDPA